MNKNVDIFIYSHKQFTPLVTNPIYKLLVNCTVEDSQFNTKLPIYRDYVGDNISKQNLIFNEYSGFYWLWKNWQLKDYIGQIHYRRYFNFMDNVPDINKLFNKHKILLNERFPLSYGGKPVNNRDFYEKWHNVEDFDLMENIVKDMYPEYAEGWDTMKESQHIYPSSLFIMPRDMFDEYMTFIFDCMDTFNDERGCHTREEWIKYVEDNHNKYIRPEHPYYNVTMQARATGYLAERCLAAYLMNGKSKSLENNAYTLQWTLI